MRHCDHPGCLECVRREIVGDMSDETRGSFLAVYDRAITMLRKLEWAGGDAGDRCPVCFRRDPHHAPNCDLATLLRELP